MSGALWEANEGQGNSFPTRVVVQLKGHSCRSSFLMPPWTQSLRTWQDCTYFLHYREYRGLRLPSQNLPTLRVCRKSTAKDTLFTVRRKLQNYGIENIGKQQLLEHHCNYNKIMKNNNNRLGKRVTDTCDWRVYFLSPTSFRCICHCHRTLWQRR